jgi:hypothetical protein
MKELTNRRCPAVGVASAISDDVRPTGLFASGVGLGGSEKVGEPAGAARSGCEGQSGSHPTLLLIVISWFNEKILYISTNIRVTLGNQ